MKNTKLVLTKKSMLIIIVSLIIIALFNPIHILFLEAWCFFYGLFL